MQGYKFLFCIFMFPFSPLPGIIYDSCFMLALYTVCIIWRNAKCSSSLQTIDTILLFLTVHSLSVCGNENEILKIILSLQDGHGLHNHQVWLSSIRNLFHCSFASLLAQPEWKVRIEKVSSKCSLKIYLRLTNEIVFFYHATTKSLYI